ncbi:MAG: V-type ATP synthase subunit I, partial [Clostridia bacterium]
RLFGLGLTTGVIGYAINILGTIIVDIFFKGLWIGWIVAAPILLIGHTFNLAINLLGAYVHNSRLQYVEFFGRFYEGSGHAFMPLGSKTKYSYLDN